MEFYREKRKPYNSIQYLFQCGRSHRCGRSLVADAHIHEYFEILYGLCGECEIRLGEETYRFGKGDMVLIDPMEVHRITSETDGDNDYLVLKFVPEVLYSSEQPTFDLGYMIPYMQMDSGHQKVYPAHELAQSGIPEILKNIFREDEEKEFGYELAVRTDICRIFLWTLRNWHKTSCDRLAQNELPSETLRTLRMAYEFIEHNYAQEIDMADAARYCGMSYTSFSKFFSRFTQCGFAEYLTLIRLKKASILLATTDRSITDIAMETGFSSTSYFIQRFKAYNDVTPSRYRRRYTETAKIRGIENVN